MNAHLDARANSRRGLLLILIAALLWGTVGVATKAIYNLADTNALSIGFFRLAIATPALLVACWRTLGRRAFRIAPLGYAALTLCSRALAGRYHPLQPITAGFGAGAIMLLPFALANGMVVTYPLAGWALLLHLGLVPTALAYVLFLAGMRHTPATVASIVTVVEPLTGTALAWVLFGERLGPHG